MRLLVTGANGQVGRSLLNEAAIAGGVTAVGLTRAELDIASPEAVERALAEHAPDVLINAAAYTAVDAAESDAEAAYLGNAIGPRELASACAQRGVPLIHLSTDYVFDGALEHPYRESDPVSPLSVYGSSKAEGEQGVREMAEQHIILRTSWVFSEHGSNFVKTIARLAAERDELRVVDDQFGGPTSARAIAAAILAMVDRYAEQGTLPWGTYHFCQLPHVSWHHFACDIAAGTGTNVVPVPSSAYPTPVVRPKNSRLSRDAFDAAFGQSTPGWAVDLTRVLSLL